MLLTEPKRPALRMRAKLSIRNHPQMTTPKAPRAFAQTAARIMALAALPLLAASGAWADSAASLLYERTLMDQAGARCHLFNPDIAAALSAANLQARGATLRSGLKEAGVRQIEARASLKAYAVPCTSPDLATAAGRVRKAFDGYAALRDMSFPGALSSWAADRKPWPLVAKGKVVPGPRWRLSQQASGGMVFGMAAGAGLVAVSPNVGADYPSAARLILRDPAKAQDAFIDPRRSDLAGCIPPRWLTQAFLASSIGPASVSLLPPGVQGGVMASFSPDAAKALAALDPREGATVELVYPTRTGERVESALIEVGDFAAGRAFLLAGR